MKLFLDIDDRQSPVWLKIKKHYEARIEELRRTNDHDASEIETAKNRGKISEAQYILDLGLPPSKPKTIPDEF